MTFQQILLSALSIIITGLASWGVAALTSWLTAKTKNEKIKKLISNAGQIILTTTKCTTQTYVDALKDKNMFTAEAQKAAMAKTKEAVLAQLNGETKELIQEMYGDIEAWITTQIESAIYDMKNSGVTFETVEVE